MDKNTVIGLLLVFVILVGYNVWMQPSKEELQRRQEIRDSIAQVEKQREALLKLEEKKKETQQQVEQQQLAVDSSALSDRLGLFAAAGRGEDARYIIETDVMKLYFDTKGGRISQVELTNFQTYDSLPLILFTPDSSKFSINFFSNNRSINTGDLFFTPMKNKDRFSNHYLKIAKGETLDFSMRLIPDGNPNSNQYIEYLYTISGDDYMIDFDVKLVGMEKYIAQNTGYLNLDWEADLRKQDHELKNTGNSTIYFKYLKDDVDNLSDTKDSDEEEITTKIKWIAFKQRFFSSILIAEESFNNANLSVVDRNADKDDEEREKERYLKSMKSEMSFTYLPSNNQTIPLKFYFGPNKYKILKKYDLELEDVIPLGWMLLRWINKYAVIKVFNFLEQFNWNYGIIILVLTLLLKLVLSPIAFKTYYSQAKMRILKPDIDKINERYPKKEDAMKKQQAIMNLYKSAGANPASGCVPMLLQFPILIAMFRFFPASFELRQQSFLWAHDLSTYDSILNLPFNIPFYGSHVSLFTLLMTASTIIYTRINDQMSSSGSQQVPGMKTMMYMMPIMFLFFFNNYAAALSYYYFLANIITFGQIYLIRKFFIDEDKIRKRMAMKKQKPIKKSGWQKRLEEMAKQQQQMQRNKKK